MYYLQSRYYDPNGHWAITISQIASAAIAAVSAVVGVAVANSSSVKQKVQSFGNAISRVFVQKKRVVKNTFSTTKEFTVTTVQDTLTDIAGRFGNFECDKAAEAMMIALKKKRRHGKNIVIQYSGMGTLNNVWSESRQMVISETGMHCGIVYEGLVY